MKKQTAVELLYDTIDNALIDFLDSQVDLHELSVAMLKAKQQALEMEQEQIESGFKDGYLTAMLDIYRNTSLVKSMSEEYYVKQYK